MLSGVVIVLAAIAGAVGGQYTRQCFTRAEVGALRFPVPARDPELPPIVIDFNQWESHYAISFLGNILINEVLGFATTLVLNGDSNTAYPRCGKGELDINLEIWPMSYAVNRALWITKLGLCLDGGPSGYSGYNAVLIPQYMLDTYPDMNLNLGQLYASSSPIMSLFQKAGTTPWSEMQDPAREFVPEWCALATNPPNMQSALNTQAYFDFKVNVTQYSPHCIELLECDSGWHQGVLQSLIRNLHLNITLPFLGYENHNRVSGRYLASKKNFMNYWWYPNTYTAKNAFSRVSFAPYSVHCYKNYSGRLDGRSSVNCDFPTQQITKVTSGRLRHNWKYDDASHLVRQLSLSDEQMMALLNLESPQISSYGDRWFNASCTWLKANTNIWQDWIQIRPPPPSPAPRALMSITPFSRNVILAILLCCVPIMMSLQVLLFKNRKKTLIINSSFVMCQVIVTGSYFGLIGIYMLGVPASWACLVAPLHLCISFNLIFGSLVGKTYRVWRIFDNPGMMTYKLTNTTLLQWVLASVAVDVFVVVMWSVFDAPAFIRQSVDSTVDNIVCVSTTSQMYQVLLIAPKIMVALYGSFLSYKVRGLPQNFNETKFIGAALYNLTIAGMIIAVLNSMLANQPSERYVFISAGLLSGIVFTELVLFVPKIYAVYTTNGAEGGARGLPYRRSTVGMESPATAILAFNELLLTIENKDLDAFVDLVHRAVTARREI